MTDDLIAWALRLRAWYASLGRYGHGAVRVLDRWIAEWRKE